MVLQIGADARQIGADLDAQAPQVGSRTDAGPQQHGRSLQRAGRQHDFGAGMILDRIALADPESGCLNPVAGSPSNRISSTCALARICRLVRRRTASVR